MVKKMIDFDVVRELALALPEVEASTIHGAPSLKVRGKLLACPALHRSAEPNTLAVRLDFAQRARLIETTPSIYYVTEHYLKYPTVLVRLSRMDRDAVRELLHLAWGLVRPQPKTIQRRGRNESEVTPKRAPRARESSSSARKYPTGHAPDRSRKP